MKRKCMHSGQDHRPQKGCACAWFIKKVIWGCGSIEDQEEVACTNVETLLWNALDVESGDISPNVCSRTELI